MRRWLLSLLGVLTLLFAMIVSAVSHEADIQKQCADKGRSSLSTWLGEIKCSPMENADEH